jgi:hypothetical protein
MTVALLFLGQLTIQAQAFLSYMSKYGYKVAAINTLYWPSSKEIDDSNIPVYNLYEDSKIRATFGGRLEWYRKAAFYTVARNLNLKNNKIKRIIDKTGIDIIYGSWGSQSLPEIGIAQKLHVPRVYEFLTYPTSSKRLAEKVENFFNRQIVNSLDGRVLSTQKMSYYMKNVFGVPRGENFIFMECYPEKFYYKKRLPLLSGLDGQPHIVFIGMDVYDILPQIEEVASRKIHVHMCDVNQAGWDKNKPRDASRMYAPKNASFVHPFNRFTYREIADGTFATFLTQFDACLVTYNFSGASSLSRFTNSIPSRFSIALLAGIPIVVLDGYLKGCEEIIGKHQIGFAYKNYADLSNKLNNKSMLNSYQKNAVNNSRLFSLENNFNRMDKFLKRIINYQ